ncbi:MAG: cytochrome c1, partial [Betaproteobacteria bacterium]|nr:cytochrome c1 [Betaproteobacteria bacterium]
MKTLFKSFLAAIAASLTFAAAPAAFAAGGPVALDAIPAQKLSDRTAMQNGAKTFMSYCLGCHGLSAMRYSRLADIGMTEEQIKAIMPPGAKPGDYIRTSLNRAEAKDWFGAAPPDLSVTARSRSSHSGAGTDWIYTFLRTYYEDASRPTGWNNKTYVGVGMPHVLWDVQKSKSPAEFDSMVGDLAAFLNYVSEPAQFSRKTIGLVVMVFLAVFFVLAWRLNK